MRFSARLKRLRKFFSLDRAIVKHRLNSVGPLDNANMRSVYEYSSRMHHNDAVSNREQGESALVTAKKVRGLQRTAKIRLKETTSVKGALNKREVLIRGINAASRTSAKFETAGSGFLKQAKKDRRTSAIYRLAVRKARNKIADEKAKKN